MWDWYSIIKADRDYDWAFLLAILEFKMRRMSKAITYDGTTVTASKRGRELLVCAILCKRIREENYNDTSWLFKEIYGELEMLREPLGASGSVRVTMEWTKARKDTMEHQRASKEYVRMSRKAELQQQRDIDYLFDTMKRKLLGWWE